MSNVSKRSAAKQAVETLERPEGISVCKWRGVLALLRAIAEFYPNPYPSQQTLAEKTGYDVRSIRRYVALAKANGLLLVKADAGRKGINNSWSKTNRYLITIEDSLRGMSEDRKPSKPSGYYVPCGEELRSSHTPCESSLSVGMVRHDPEGQSRQVGPNAKPSRSKYPPRRPTAEELVVASGRADNHVPRPPKNPPWRRTAARFMTLWDEMVTKTPSGDALRSVRPADSLGHFQRYLNAHFFGKDALTPKNERQVADLIVQFVDQCYRRQITIKDGQSAWMAFTGAWGRGTLVAPSTADTIREYFKSKGVSQ